MITDRQAEYRAYLTTPIWKAKRSEALAFYGCICNRCKEYGNDVHHKTYERVGGDELMEDLEILCRECHEAHHALDGVAKDRKTHRRTIHRRAICDKLTIKHVEILMAKYPRIKTMNDLFIAVNKPRKNQIAADAAYLLGCELLSDKEASGFGSFVNRTFRKGYKGPRKKL